MKIVMVASEAKPFCKTGGLADVVYSLSKELTVMGEEVTVILPFYQTIKNNLKHPVKKVDHYNVYLSWRRCETTAYETYVDGITYYFLECPQYFDRGNLYGDFDDGERFAYFTIAARELLTRINLIPDIIHVHDWQAAMLPCCIKENTYFREIFKHTKFVLTIHNPAFQGMIDPSSLEDLYNLPRDLYENGQCRHDGRVSTLKSGIVYADKITTVSPTHAEELLTVQGGMHLDGVLELRRDDFSGILNGIDYNEFDPEHDELIKANYNQDNFFEQKAANKKALFEELHIKDYGQPTFAMVTRITWQKGFDIIFPAIEELANKGCNIVILGSGERKYEVIWEDIRSRYPSNVAIYIGYNETLAHKIYAASDFFMMPSLFEPCGLGQMIAQRYGSLPIVRRTGGLKDSVINYDGNNQETSNGFGFDNYACDDMRYTCNYAYDAYKNTELIKKLMKNAMLTDNSWKKSAEQYLSLYQSVIK